MLNGNIISFGCSVVRVCVCVFVFILFARFCLVVRALKKNYLLSSILPSLPLVILQLGLLNATYGGLGQSLGSLLGGSLSARFGTAQAFLVYAGVDVMLLLGFLFWGLHPKGHNRNREPATPPVTSPEIPLLPPHSPGQQSSALAMKNR